MKYAPTYERSYGAKYEADLTLAEIAKRMREDIKAAKKSGRLPADVKAAVRCGKGTGIGIFWEAEGVLTIGHTSKHNAFLVPTERYDEIQQVLVEIHAAYNHDGSDVQTDYFDVRYYGRPEGPRWGLVSQVKPHWLEAKYAEMPEMVTILALCKEYDLGQALEAGVKLENLRRIRKGLAALEIKRGGRDLDHLVRMDGWARELEIQEVAK